jgi:hypothetical protein
MVRRKATIGVMLVAMAVAGCETEPGDPLGGSQTGTALRAEQATNPVVVARSVSSFGGMYLDQVGRPTVYLTDMNDAPRARRALSEFAAEHGRDADEIRFVQAKYNVNELNGWYERTWPAVMEQAGTVFSDLDESTNRMVFGVEHAGAANGVRAMLRARGVPDDAYAINVVEPIRNVATLRDNVNPKVGGLQIHFSNYLCTLGFNVTWNGVASFITNSHCTATQGGVENTLYYQPTSTVNSTVIAQEVADPGYVKGQPAGCPRNKRCRYSDSSRAEYRSGISFDLGGIASTSGSNLTITGTHNITAEADANRTPVAVGATVSKTGRTTGTSTGQVTNTCVNTSVQGSNIMQLCQTFVAAAVGSGDSGSPVYSGTGSVTLVGILWGGGTNSFAFSPLRSIKDELGNFTAH